MGDMATAPIEVELEEELVEEETTVEVVEEVEEKEIEEAPKATGRRRIKRGTPLAE